MKTGITAILTTYRRPGLLIRQVDAIRGQSRPPEALWLWANEPDDRMQAEIEALKLDRIVVCSANAYDRGRFALALLAPTRFVALFDDDALPGPDWFRNCLEVMDQTPGILGSAGVRLQADNYRSRTLCGWHVPCERTTEVDLVEHAWFLKTEWVRYLFSAPPVVGTDGEDIEIAARAFRLGGIPCFCPPHPADARHGWGSTQGAMHGRDAATMSRRPEHLDERDWVVRAEMASGWKPLYLRQGTAAAPAPSRPGQEVSPHVAGAATALDMRARWLLELIPTTARRILEIGCGTGELGAALKARQGASVTGTEADHRLAIAAQGRLDHVLEVQADVLEADLPGAPFDCVVCQRPDTLRDPDRWFRRMRGWLAKDGTVVCLFPNIRHHTMVGALLDGSWGYQPSGPVDRDSVCFFTLREVEKLLYRCGFQCETLEALPGPESGKGQGNHGVVQVGQLHITGLPAGQAGEFYASHFRAAARSVKPEHHGLTSIVVLTRNQLAYTRLCLESIALRTDEEHELVIVDNGSTDGTVEYLKALPHATVILNPSNRGFPAGVNQGIRAAKGRQVVLLNNDTIVATGWLRRMLQALHSDSRIGLVGPCSNCVSGEQEVPIGYAPDLMSLDGFAWDWGKDHDRQLEDTDRLVGFCLLIRKEVIDAVGHLDERFGVGCYEDDDYCLRTLRAGYRAVIARDSFVHHFGGRTFVGEHMDFAAVMSTNEQLYRRKWAQGELPPKLRGGVDPDQSTGALYGLQPSAAGGLLLTSSTPRLSLCMIVRDNAGTIAACLESIRPWVDEMIVVDTGSKDRTPHIAQCLGARLFHFPWRDSFSAARNESLRHACGAWIFWMDSDDVIDAVNGKKMRDLAYQDVDENLMGYVMQVHCPGPGTEGTADVTVVDHIKLFRNRGDLRFEGRIHEQILPAIRRAGGDVTWTDVFVVHAGYDHSPAGQARKLERDLRLLHLEIKEQPDHPFTLFNLGMTYADQGDYGKAESFLKRSIAASGPEESHLRKAYALLAYSQARADRLEVATATCAEGLRKFPRDVELRFRQAVILQEAGRVREAAQLYQEILEVPGERHFTSVDRGIAGFKARQNLAILYTELEDHSLAEAQWRRVVAEEPHYRAGWRGLGDSLLAQKHYGEAMVLAQQMATKSTLGAEARLLHAAVAMSQGALAEARSVLQQAMMDYDDDLDTRQAWCRFLFEHGSPAEAAQALAILVERSPADAAALHNLGLAYLRMGLNNQAAAAFRQSVHLRPASASTQQLLDQCTAAGIEGV